MATTLGRTEQILIDQYGAIMLNMDQLASEMQITKRSLQTMLAADRCPVKTIGTGKLRRAHITSVAAWMDGKNQ